MSQITTHVLDTSIGKPAYGITIKLFEFIADEWIEKASGITNKDGRIGNLIPANDTLTFGTYKMVFDTKHYFEAHKIEVFYPSVEIIFNLHTIEHYHIPLLLNPFGYTTYRGS